MNYSQGESRRKRKSLEENLLNHMIISIKQRVQILCLKGQKVKRGSTPQSGQQRGASDHPLPHQKAALKVPQNKAKARLHRHLSLILRTFVLKASILAQGKRQETGASLGLADLSGPPNW